MCAEIYGFYGLRVLLDIFLISWVSKGFVFFPSCCNTLIIQSCTLVFRIVNILSSVNVDMIDRITLKPSCTFMLISSLIDILVHQSFRDS